MFQTEDDADEWVVEVSHAPPISEMDSDELKERREAKLRQRADASEIARIQAHIISGADWELLLIEQQLKKLSKSH